MEKSILGNTNSHYNLAPIKYKWAYDMADKSLKNHWVPSQIGIGNDLETFKKLSLTEQHLFKSVFATLTTSDICIQRNLAICIYECVTAPELHIFIGNQIKEEAVHSIAYQYVIEHLGFNEYEIYNLYKDVPEIAQKFALAEFYSKFILEYQDTKDITSLLIGLIFYYLCFEGGWFYNGFSPIFSLGRRNLMTASSEQLQYIMRDESAHTAFGTRLIKEILAEYSHKINQRTIRDIFNDVVRSETIYASYAIPTIPGYTAAAHVEHLKYLLDRRARAIGFQNVFNAENQFPWLDELVNIKKEKNFFETHVMEYQTGAGLMFETSNVVVETIESTEFIDSISNWNR